MSKSFIRDFHPSAFCLLPFPKPIPRKGTETEEKNEDGRTKKENSSLMFQAGLKNSSFFVLLSSFLLSFPERGRKPKKRT
jgi:hypothetical protein